MFGKKKFKEEIMREVIKEINDTVRYVRSIKAYECTDRHAIKASDTCTCEHCKCILYKDDAHVVKKIAQKTPDIIYIFGHILHRSDNEVNRLSEDYVKSTYYCQRCKQSLGEKQYDNK